MPDAARGKIWVADLPAQFERCSTVYDGEDRLPRARGKGFAPVDARDKTTAADRIAFPAGALRNWPDLREGELLVIPTADYEMSILPLATVDEEAHVATTSAAASRPIGKVKFVPIRRLGREHPGSARSTRRVGCEFSGTKNLSLAAR